MKGIDNVSVWGDALLSPLQTLWADVLEFLPELISAIIILLLGMMVARLLAKLVYKVLKTAKVDVLMEKIGITGEFEKIGWDFSFSRILADIVKIFFVVVTFVAVVDILNINQLSEFLDKILLYIPNVFIAIVILAIGIVVGKFFEDITIKAMGKITKNSAQTLGTVAKMSVVIFSFMAALIHLGIAQSLIQILFTGFVAMLALAGGIAFGLGGKDTAASLLKKLDL